MVYWCDEIEEAVGWLYLPISEFRLKQLKNKELSYREAFKNPETVCYLFYIDESGKETIDLYDDTVEDFCPPEGYYMEYINQGH